MTSEIATDRSFAATGLSRRRLTLAPDLLLYLLRQMDGKQILICTGIPKDAVIEITLVDVGTDNIVLWVSSREFTQEQVDDPIELTFTVRPEEASG
jgi:hypothetical protein